MPTAFSAWLSGNARPHTCPRCRVGEACQSARSCGPGIRSDTDDFRTSGAMTGQISSGHVRSETGRTDSVTEYTIQTATADDWDALYHVLETAFHDEASEEAKAAERLAVEFDRVLVAR